jgi:hypothetical protein
VDPGAVQIVPEHHIVTCRYTKQGLTLIAGPESRLGLHASDPQTSLTLVTAAVRGLRGHAGVVVTRVCGRRSEGR